MRKRRGGYGVVVWSLGKIRHWWLYKLRKGPEETLSEGWTLVDMAQDMDKWRALVNTD